MKSGTVKPVRCAIYTRVSTDHGLEQDFNSLDAQHDAAQSYIRSQTHAGWVLIRSRYDDGGYSGGSTDRPALQRLDEIVAGAVTGVEQIAARDKCSIRQVNMTITLAFLAPELVKAAVEGRLPRGIGIARLRDAPAEWSRQYAMLGLSL